MTKHETPRARPHKGAERLASKIGERAGWDRAYPASALAVGSGWILAGRKGPEGQIALGAPDGRRPRWTSELPAVSKETPDGVIFFLAADHAALVALREAHPFLSPRPTGSTSSFGFGDRTGLATPGHLEALRGSGFFPNLAQQSIREMTRTQRSPAQVLDAAVFGALQSGHTSGFGADADHLKTLEDVDRCAEAGFVMFTLDAIEKVIDKAPGLPDRELEEEYRKILGEVPGARGWEKKYLGKTFRFDRKLSITFEGRAWREGVVKYGRAIPYWLEMEKRVRQKTRGRACEIEIAVDETGAVTTAAEHLFIVRELKERGMTFQGLAPRFVGEFEKGVDYKGDPKAFTRSVEEHAILARAHGGYKISVHSGSDKFSIYPAIARATGGHFHLKTAGTSWMEALRVVARKAPGLFREISEFARGQFSGDRASYHISADPARVPPPSELADGDLERVYVKEDEGRQLLHVTYGAVLTTKDREGNWLFRDRIFDLLVREEDAYREALALHLGRHIRGLRARSARKRPTPTGARR